jgi:2-keto-4-pentenoate hydratase/2-oxohepta-3-ene-1,7-dioic acid hydratase in catechol pathway
MSNALTFVGSGTPVSAPSYSDALDYELELGAVLAKPLLNATPEQALDAIGGFVVLNDFSARDVQREEMTSGFGPQKAKHFRSSMSEVLVTADELLADVNRLAARVLINERPVVETSTEGMQYGLAEVIARVSRDEPLFPGELFGSGTLPGGSGMENGHWLKPGDRLRMEIDRVGVIEHEVVA